MIRRLLTVNPAQRPSASDTLQLPWVAGGTAPDRPLDIVPELSRFTRSQKLQKAGQRLLRLQSAGMMGILQQAGAEGQRQSQGGEV